MRDAWLLSSSSCCAGEIGALLDARQVGVRGSVVSVP